MAMFDVLLGRVGVKVDSGLTLLWRKGGYRANCAAYIHMAVASGPL